MGDTQPFPIPRPPLTVWGRMLLVLFVMNGVSAVAGSIGVMKDLLPFPEVWLQGTPFHSYVLPGVILGAVVGGSQLAAAYILLRRTSLAKIACPIAGLILIAWMTAELTLIGFQAPIQVWFIALGLLEISLSFTKLVRS